MTFEEYLNRKHMDYCMASGSMISVMDWVNDELNPRLPKDDKLNYVTVTQWMQRGRQPDTKNISKLIQVFGSEVVPSLDLKLDATLTRLLRDWDKITPDKQNEILDLMEASIKESGELITQAA